MPQYRHLSPADKLAYRAGILEPHERRVILEVQTLTGDPQRRLHLTAFEGQVDTTKGSKTEVSRVLTLRAADARQVLNFDSASPGEGLFFDRMVQVRDERYIPALNDWVTAIPFTGPIWSFRRTGSIVELTAHGKERLAMGALWTPYNLHKGFKRTAELRNLMQMAGETNFDLPDLAARIPEKKGLDRFASIWEHATKLADSVNRQLFYTGDGTCTLRKLPGHIDWAFKDGEGGSVLTEPEIERSLDDAANLIIVRGKQPKGNMTRPYSIVRLPPGHPLSAQTLGRNGQPRYLVVEVENDSLRTAKECSDFGARELADRLRSVVNASFEAPPIPIFEPGNIGRLRLPDGHVEWRMWTHSLPLAGGNMSVGALRRARPIRMRKKRHQSHHKPPKHKPREGS